MSASDGSSNMTASQLQAFEDELELGCHALDPRFTPIYGYTPSLAVGIVFCVLFGIPLIYHAFQFCRVRRATSILLALGAVTEVIGWAARIYASRCPYNSDAFLAQEVTLIIAPVFFSAALYVLLGLLIIDLGRASSLLSAKWYTIVFCTCDLISLVIQAVGGAMASTADTDDQQVRGTHIMVAGIAFQLGTMTLFGLMAGDFVRRIGAGWGGGGGGGTRPGLRGVAVTPRLRLILSAIFISFLMIYIRSIYRTIELAEGWSGYLITHQGYFVGLDAAIMVVAVGVFIPIDPAVLLGKPGHGHGLGHGLEEAVGAKQVSGMDASDGEAGMAGMAMGSHSGGEMGQL